MPVAGCMFKSIRNSCGMYPNAAGYHTVKSVLCSFYSPMAVETRAIQALSFCGLPDVRFR